MASRAEQKARTRNALIDSWLRLIGDGANFASVSLREVAKAAGVVPTSFYRHFGDMDELGVAAVDELGLDLRRLVRGEWDSAEPVEVTVHRFVEAYHRYVLDHTDLVQFVDQARTGGTPALRKAIGNELEFLSARIAAALTELVPGLKAAERDTTAQVIVAVLLENTTTLLGLPPRSQARQEELREDAETKIHLVLRGAADLVPTTPAPRKRRPKAQETA